MKICFRDSDNSETKYLIGMKVLTLTENVALKRTVYVALFILDKNLRWTMFNLTEHLYI